jgi:hypothetical protein
MLRTIIAALGLALTLSACGSGEGSDASRPASFELRLRSASVAALQNSDGLMRVQVIRRQGFAGVIEVGLANPPAGVSSGAVVVETGDEAWLPLRISSDVPVGSMTLTFYGVGGGATVTTNLEVVIGAAQPRSPALIQAALDTGQIDYGTSLVYRAYAVFGDPRLPDAFVGSGPAEEDIDLFIDIERDRTTLPVAVIDQLQPFLLRPDDPNSFFNAGRPNNRAGRQSAAKPAAAAVPTPANNVCSGATREWISARSTQQPVRVWTLCEGTDITNLYAEGNLRRVLDVVDKAFGKMVALMGPAVPDLYHDDLIDIYVVPPNADAPRQRGAYAVEGVRGVAFPQPNFAGRTSSGYIMLPTWRVFQPDYQLTVIHELFHTLQFAHNYKTGPWWFREASATWASFHFNRTAPIDPPDNKGLHMERFGGYQSSSEGLLSLVDDHNYKSYIWPFFMEHKRGGPEIIARAWREVESSTTAEQSNNVLDSMFSFKDNFREFGLRNLNKPYLPGDPLTQANRYVGLDNVFPDKSHLPSTPKSIFRPIFVGTQDSFIPDPVEPLAAVYFEAKVQSAAVKKVVFDLGGVNVAGIDVAALVKINGTWEPVPRDLNGKGELKFCLDRPEEKLDEIVFIVGNYQKQSGATVAASLGVKASADPCALVWEGGVDTTIDFTIGDLIGKMSSNAQVAFEFDGAASSGGRIVYRVRAGNFNYQARFDQPTRNPPCRSLQTGSGVIRPQLTPTDLADGASSGSVATFVSAGGKPQYQAGGVLTFTTLTTIDNCNSSNVDVTTTAPMSAIVLWVPQNGNFDIKLDGTTMQESSTVVVGPETRSSTWNLAKKAE